MKRKKSFYEKCIKRPLGFICALLAIVVLSPVLLLTAILVRIKLGNPVLFKQKRPGLNERNFTLYKFRTMTNDWDARGNLLPDDMRLTKFGKILRSTSLDELPELFNILKGDMAVVGPRPQLVRDIVFMTKEQRYRHVVRPGLTGLAQVNGRNTITWEQKINYDLEYLENISVKIDFKIILKTFLAAFVKREGINGKGKATAEDYGDYLLRLEKIDHKAYEEGQLKAEILLKA